MASLKGAEGETGYEGIAGFQGVKVFIFLSYLSVFCDLDIMIFSHQGFITFVGRKRAHGCSWALWTPRKAGELWDSLFHNP